MDKKSRYWLKIKENIELLYLNKEISENYTYEKFCNDFTPSELPLDEPVENQCLCGHDIIYNYTYENDVDTFILGSCCIKTFSSFYKNKRSCIDCNIKIKKNKENRCLDCRNLNKKRLKKEEEERLKQEEQLMREKERKEKEEEEERLYLNKCKCQDCGYVKKDTKYKYCYHCFNKRSR